MCHDDVQRVLDDLNHTHDLHFVLAAKAAGGMTNSAWLLCDERSGKRAVLKTGTGFSLAHLRRAEQAVVRLRAGGYPTPAWLAVGESADGVRYHLQELFAGEPADPLTAAKTRALVDLLATHRGLDPLPERDWSAYLVSDLPACIEDLRRLAPLAHDLVSRYERLFAQLGPVDLPSGDLVHGDFNSCNVLMVDGKVSGVIDVEALGSGTRAIDHAWLLREAYAEGAGDAESIRTIRQAGEAVAGGDVLIFCTAYTALDWLRWMATHLPRDVPDILGGLDRLATDLT